MIAGLLNAVLELFRNRFQNKFLYKKLLGVLKESIKSGSTISELPSVSPENSAVFLRVTNAYLTIFCISAKANCLQFKPFLK